MNKKTRKNAKKAPAINDENMELVSGVIQWLNKKLGTNVNPKADGIVDVTMTFNRNGYCDVNVSIQSANGVSVDRYSYACYPHDSCED